MPDHPPEEENAIHRPLSLLSLSTTPDHPPEEEEACRPPSTQTTSSSTSGAVGCGQSVGRDESNISFHLSQLIDHVIASRWTPVDMFHIRRKQYANHQTTPEEPEYARYLELWKEIVPPPSFNTLPIPTPACKETKKSNKPPLPDYISHPSFEECHVENQKKKDDDKKAAAEARRAKLALERERKKQEKEVADKEKKRLQKEQKELEKATKGKGKGKGKKRILDNDEEGQ